jgi:hypothetical protein
MFAFTRWLRGSRKARPGVAIHGLLEGLRPSSVPVIGSEPQRYVRRGTSFQLARSIACRCFFICSRSRRPRIRSQVASKIQQTTTGKTTANTRNTVFPAIADPLDIQKYSRISSRIHPWTP